MLKEKKFLDLTDIYLYPVSASFCLNFVLVSLREESGLGKLRKCSCFLNELLLFYSFCFC